MEEPGYQAPMSPMSPTGPPGTTPGPPQGHDSAVWSKLNELLTKKPGYNREAPENALQLDVNRVGNQRAAERRRSSAAERAAQEGWGTSGAFDTEIDKILADQGMADTSFEAQLARDSVNRDRDEIMQALGIGAGLTGQGMSLTQQRQLAELDAQLRREGLSLQALLGKGQIGNQLLGLLLNSQLGNDKLAFDYADLIARMNSGAFNFAGGR